MRLLALSLLAALSALAPASAHEFTLGDLTIGHPYALASPFSSAAGYLTVTNTGDEPDALLEVRSAFPATTLHTMETLPDSVIRMDEVERFDIAPGETLTLEPVGSHIMFEGLTEPLEAGETLPVTLVFEQAGKVEVVFNIEPLSSLRNSNSANHEHMDHDLVRQGEDGEVSD